MQLVHRIGSFSTYVWYFKQEAVLVYSVLNVCEHIKIYPDFNKQNKLRTFLCQE